MKIKTIVKKVSAGVIATMCTVGLLTACGTTKVVVNTEQQTEVTDVEEAKVAETTEKVEEATTETTVQPGDNKLYVSFPTGNIRVTVNILADQLGYFEEEGVEVIPVNLAGPNALTAIDSGSEELDVLTVGFIPDLQALASGYDLAFVGGTAVEGGAIVAKSGEASKYLDGDKISVDAFTNAKLGYVRNESSWVVARQYLLDNGVSEDTIAAIENETDGNTTFYAEEIETAQAVQKGEIELGFLPMEFALLYADAYELELVTPAADLQPNYVCCREVTSNTKLNEKKDAFIAYETARIRAWEYYKKGETDEAIKNDVVNIVSAYSGKEADYVETYLYGGVTKFSCDPNSNGIQSFAKAAYNSGALSGAAVDFNTYDLTQNIKTDAYKSALDKLVVANPDDEFYGELVDLYNQYN